MAEAAHKIIAQNKKAFHDYEIIERYEAGIELLGSEVKSVRAGKINLLDSYGVVTGGEVFLHHLHISQFLMASFSSHEPYRTRRLLLHKKEIARLAMDIERKGLTLVPLSVYLKEQRVKVQLGLGRGRTKYDKREKIAAADSRRHLSSLMKSARNR